MGRIHLLLIVTPIRSTADNDDVFLARCVDRIVEILMTVEQDKAQRDNINTLLNGPFNRLYKLVRHQRLTLKGPIDVIHQIWVGELSPLFHR